MRLSIVMQAKRSYRKRCSLFFVQVFSNAKANNTIGDKDIDTFLEHPIRKQFQDVFPKEIFRLSSHRELDFSIELIIGSSPTSKAPYRIST